ncbi:putative sulfate permease 2 [Amylocarpus encephaloides]|uniref:Sulfate permease 2 n=1 Tax=Amylocarpus encephaloides TaxID=45428 RepID=A0A9P7YRF9_9HELO|nr:putative sulfate permease 2 [Amylocarpus encephaloides]
MSANKVGRGLAKALGIDLNYRNELNEEIRRGESVYSSQTAGAYVEEEPRSSEWVQGIIPSGSELATYFSSLFPFLHWIGAYNLQWLAGDLVAGVTVGCVVVPQGMAYAALAGLEVQYGLYSSFMGVLVYWFFATSKDITIGPVAVMSTLVGQIVIKAEKTHPDIPGHVIASCLAVIAGCIILFIGLIRIGWIVDLIPLVSISAFMTGSAISIAVGQTPALMGITGFDTRAATFEVIINTLKHLDRTKLDAAMGLTALFTVYAIRSGCTFAAKKYPGRAKIFFFVSTLRTAFVILLYTMISWLVNRQHREKPLFRILGKVPRGFQAAAIPQVNSTIIKIFVSDLPATVIVLLIEHIAIAKSFGRINNYIINPSQEMVAIGMTNILGPFLGGYPATGSFSRTAIMSKAGVRTPFTGVLTALILLLAIYALPAVFFYIPSAALSGVIIHAVGDLITPPNVIYQFWRVSPLEVPIFFAGVFVTVFSSIENGIYTTIVASIVILIFRLCKADGNFLGKVKIQSISGDRVVGDHSRPMLDNGTLTKSGGSHEDAISRNIFLPLNHADGSNPEIDILEPHPGIFIYRFSELFNYPNANHYLDQLTNHIFEKTRRTNHQSYKRRGDRPWNDPGPRRGKTEPDRSDRPTLKAIILDFSAVNNVDITSVQQLIDVRNQLDKYAAPSTVDWHFSSINNRWTKRALVAAGFGYPTIPQGEGDASIARWKPIFSVAELGGAVELGVSVEPVGDEKRQGAGGADADKINHDSDSLSSSSDIKGDSKPPQVTGAYKRSAVVVNGLNRPLFHIDLTSSLQSAIANVEARASSDAALLARLHLPESSV